MRILKYVLTLGVAGAVLLSLTSCASIQASYDGPVEIGRVAVVAESAVPFGMDISNVAFEAERTFITESGTTETLRIKIGREHVMDAREQNTALRTFVTFLGGLFTGGVL